MANSTKDWKVTITDPNGKEVCITDITREQALEINEAVLPPLNISDDEIERLMKEYIAIDKRAASKLHIQMMQGLISRNEYARALILNVYEGCDQEMKKSEEEVRALSDHDILVIWESLPQYDPKDLHSPGVTIEDWAELVYSEKSRRHI